MAKVREKTETSARNRNRDSTARTHVNTTRWRHKEMYRTNGHTSPGKDHITSQYIRHYHAKWGVCTRLIDWLIWYKHTYKNTSTLTPRWQVSPLHFLDNFQPTSRKVTAIWKFNKTFSKGVACDIDAALTLFLRIGEGGNASIPGV